MRVDREIGYILHTRNYRETSLIVEVFARRHGRLGLIAKGAKRQKSGMVGILNSFHPLLLSWSGRGELATLTNAESVSAYDRLAGDTLYCAFYLNELLMRLLHRHDAHETLFDSYQEALATLRTQGAGEPVLRIFEKRLLQELGYALVLDHDVERAQSIDPEALYQYVPERGPIQANGKQRHGIEVHGTSLLDLDREELENPRSRRETKRLMRAVLARHLGDKPLQSRLLLQQVFKLRADDLSPE